jgi:hypothetical protein
VSSITALFGFVSFGSRILEKNEGYIYKGAKSRSVVPDEVVMLREVRDTVMELISPVN